MLYLVTGTPGAGKTLNTLKFVSQSEQFHNRGIYYHGIKELLPEFGWTELTEEQCLNWFDLPEGSVIVFDEAYTLFPVRHGSKRVPEQVEKLATHRHGGYDIVMICQKVTGQLDPFIRGLVGQHHHYARIFGSKTVNRFTWDSCQDNPNASSSRSNSNMKPMRLDKKYYGVYHSADEHTHKTNLPWFKIGMVLVAASICIALIWWLFDRMNGRVNPDSNTVTINSSREITQHTPYSRDGKKQLSFAQNFTPNVEGIPWSAPAYSDAIEPKTWPRPAACINHISSNACNCYTQQGTKLDVSVMFCLNVVQNGFFDWTKEDYNPNNQPDIMGRVGGLGESSLTPDQPAHTRHF